jgi:hypothetical protein
VKCHEERSLIGWYCGLVEEAPNEKAAPEVLTLPEYEGIKAVSTD